MLGKTVSELLSSLTSSEITEWIAYLNLKNEIDKPDAHAQLSKMFSGRIKKKKKAK